MIFNLCYVIFNTSYRRFLARRCCRFNGAAGGDAGAGRAAGDAAGAAGAGRAAGDAAGAAGAGRAAGDAAGAAGAGRAAGGAPMPFKYASIQRQKKPLRETPSDAEYSSALAFTAGGKRKR